MQNLLLLIFSFFWIFIGILNLGAQNVQWVETGSGTQYNSGNSVACDDQGNSYVTGYYYGSLSMGGQTVNSQGSWDIFIAKFDISGNLSWLKSAGGQASDWGNDIAVDPAGNVYITGHFTVSANFGGFTLSAISPGVPSVDGYVAKYDPNGNVLWAKNIGTGSLGIYVDSLGNAYVTGSSQMLFAKFNSTGQLVNVKLNSNPNPVGQEILCNQQGEVYVAGRFTSSLTIDTATVSTNYVYDVFVAKLDSNWNLSWLTQGYTSGFYNYCDGLSFDNAQNIYLTGYYEDSLSFGSSDTLHGMGNYRGFLSKISPTGTVLKLKGFNNNGGQSSAVKDNTVKNNKLVVTGSFVYKVTLDTTQLFSQGGFSDLDFFIATYNDTLGLESVKQISGLNDQEAYGIAANDQSVFFTGYYCGLTTFDTLNINCNSYADIFVAKMGNPTVGLTEANLTEIHIKIFPNPSHGFVTVSLDEKDFNGLRLYGENMEIFDQLGRVVYRAKMTGPRLGIDLSELGNGLYRVRVGAVPVGQSLLKF